MPIAAVPDYLAKQSTQQATPADRFGMLLPIWTDRKDQEIEVNARASKKSREAADVRELMQVSMDYAIQNLTSSVRNPLPGLWKKNDNGAKGSWQKVVTLTKNDAGRMAALSERSTALAQTLAPGSVLEISAHALSPLTTGMGIEHPLENGFAFLTPYGLPYLPGSSIKGVIRNAADELARGQWGADKGLRWKPGYAVSITNKDTAELTAIDVLFGLLNDPEDQHHFRGVLNFWDVVPQLANNTLTVEIMTPHQSHYIQGNRPESPHESGQPNPISFLSIPAESTFDFVVSCNVPRLQKVAPALARDDNWKTLLAAAFEHAFQWVGFGAKTAVGYGAMERNTQAELDKQNARKEALVLKRRKDKERQEKLARQAHLETLEPIDKAIRLYLDNRPDKSQGEGSALVSAIDSKVFIEDFTNKELARKAKDFLKKENIWREKSEKKDPRKDKLYTRTMKVMAWLEED